VKSVTAIITALWAVFFIIDMRLGDYMRAVGDFVLVITSHYLWMNADEFGWKK
jgi:hypothetical protein